MSETISINLKKRERELIHQYGYPFEEIAQQLDTHRTKRGSAVISDHAYWWEQVIHNLCISLKESFDNDLLADELERLIDEISDHLEQSGRFSAG